jgi:hypothetical protein
VVPVVDVFAEDDDVISVECGEEAIREGQLEQPSEVKSSTRTGLWEGLDAAKSAWR